MTESQPGGAPLRRWDPERIGPYVILGRLGAGAMGQVYLGRSPAGRLVAVKTIKVDLAEEAGFRTRFAQEVAAVILGASLTGSSTRCRCRWPRIPYAAPRTWRAKNCA